MTSVTSDEAATITSIGAEILIPGPFVVLQGMRGDGMANTMDSIPVLVDQEMHRSSRLTAAAAAATSAGNPRGTANLQPRTENVTEVDRDILQRLNSERSAGDDTETDLHMDVHVTRDHRTKRHSKLQNRTRGTPAILQTHTSGSQSSGELVTSGDHVHVPQEISSLVPNDPTAAETSSEGGYHPSESAGESSDGDALFYDSTSSASSVDPQHAIGTTGVIAHHRSLGSGGESAAIGSDGGLHLPMPPSAVAGMGYNTFLAPISPSRTDAQRHDDFVLVQPNNSISSNNISNIMNNSSTNLSLMSTSSSSIVDISRSFSSHNSTRYTNMMPQERNSIKQWNRGCRKRETQQRNEMRMNANPQSGTRATSNSQQNRSQWWKMKSNCLAVFDSLPVPVDGSNSNIDNAGSAAAAATNTTTNTTTPVESAARINPGKIVGELSPGCTVMGVEMIHIDKNTLQPLPPHDTITETDTSDAQGDSRRTGVYQFLRIESPLIGYVLFGIDGYTYLGPGLPSYYADPEVWTWRVTCPDGAYVRQGLELTSVHVDTIPYGAFARVTRKTVNAMGLSRLQIEASVQTRNVRTTSSATLRNRGLGTRGAIRDALSTHSECTSIIGKETSTRNIVGWVSEALNPLSGQSGPIVQPMPFPVPILYRVTLIDGAVIRSDVELSSAQIGHAPMNAILNVVGRAYSNHPQDQCIERLKLAGGGGWVSVRLNRAFPRDHIVLEMVGIDGAFDPNEPGLYHLEKQKQVVREYNQNANTRSTDHADQDVQDISRSLDRLNTGEISSIEDGGNDTVNGAGQTGANALENSEISHTASSMTSVPGLPALYRSGIGAAAGDMSVGSHTSVKGCGSKALVDEMCLICLTENRTATIVHGSTGHIACCLMCARILKGRGDRCPVCRLPIDSVIQQFWA